MQHTMDTRAHLLERSLDAGLAPLEALTAAQRMWRFVRDGDGAPDGRAAIIGIEYSQSRGWRRIDVDGNRFEPQDGFFDSHPVWGEIRTVSVEGQMMVEIPAFYVRREHSGDAMRLWVSPQPAAGFHRHAAFRLLGIDLPAVQVGAYEACPNGDVAGSLAGVDPLTRIDFPAMQRACRRHGGNGFGLWSIYELSAIQTLVLIEVGSPDVQGEVGFGNVHGGGPKLTGSTSACWRGIHELWGNVLHMVDGLQHDPDGQILLWDEDGHGSWVHTGIQSAGLNSIGAIDGFRSEQAFADVFLPSAIGRSDDGAILSDLYVAPDVGRPSVAYHGGDWSNGSRAGLFALDCNNTASGSGSLIGGRLARRVLHPET